MTDQKTEGYIKCQSNYERLARQFLKGFPSYFTEFYEWLDNGSESTKYQYILDVCNFYEQQRVRFGYDEAATVDQITDLFTQKLTAADVETFVKAGNAVAATSTKRKAAITKFYHFMQWNGVIILQNLGQIARISKLRNNVEKKALNKKQIHKLIDNALHPEKMRLSKCVERRYLKFKTMHALLIRLAIESGSRSCSITQISVDDLNWYQDGDSERLVIDTIQKGGSYHKIIPGEQLTKSIKLWLQEREEILSELGVSSNFLFINLRGGQLTNSQYNEILEKLSYGINDFDQKITSHVMRHTAGTITYQNHQGDLKYVADHLGHRSIATSAIYSHNENDRFYNDVNALESILY